MNKRKLTDKQLMKLWSQMLRLEAIDEDHMALIRNGLSAIEKVQLMRSN